MELINLENYYSYGIKEQKIIIGFELSIENSRITLDNIQYPPHSVKLFLVCLKSAITKLIDMEKYKKMAQHVLLSDWDMFLNKDSNWSIIKTYEQDTLQLCVIECDLDKSVECVARGLGIYEQGTNYKTVMD